MISLRPTRFFPRAALFFLLFVCLSGAPLRASGDSLGILVDGAGDVGLSWDPAVGVVTIERSDDLGTWASIDPVNGDGVFTDGSAPSTRGFYRLQVVDMVDVAGSAEVEAFRIGRTEVTLAVWQAVRDWAVDNGYADLAGIGAGAGPGHPVGEVSWHDVLKWCNAKSEREGFAPVYTVNGTVYRAGETVPAVDGTADGYRLPMGAEWQWAASGGISSAGYEFSGSNTAADVAWYYNNKGDGPRSVGGRAANELGIHDMSGNVWEWCWDEEGFGHRMIRGGNWYLPSSFCRVGGIYSEDPAARGTYDALIGFRVVRSAAP